MSSLRLLLLAFAVGFGAVVAYRLNTEAMAVIVGVLMGILGSLPVALLILYTLRRGDKKTTSSTESAPYSGYSGWTPYATPHPAASQPQIIVVGGLPQGQPAPWGYGLPAPAPPPAPPPAANSRFNLIPYDTEDDV